MCLFVICLVPPDIICTDLSGLCSCGRDVKYISELDNPRTDSVTPVGCPWSIG